MTQAQTELTELLKKIAVAALDAGVAPSDAQDGDLHNWMRVNVIMRPEQEFFAVLLVASEMFDEMARREGYADKYDKMRALRLARGYDVEEQP